MAETYINSPDWKKSGTIGPQTNPWEREPPGFTPLLKRAYSYVTGEPVTPTSWADLAAGATGSLKVLNPTSALSSYGPSFAQAARSLGREGMQFLRERIRRRGKPFQVAEGLEGVTGVFHRPPTSIIELTPDEIRKQGLSFVDVASHEADHLLRLESPDSVQSYANTELRRLMTDPKVQPLIKTLVEGHAYNPGSVALEFSALAKEFKDPQHPVELISDIKEPIERISRTVRGLLKAQMRKTPR